MKSVFNKFSVNPGQIVDYLSIMVISPIILQEYEVSDPKLLQNGFKITEL